MRPDATKKLTPAQTAYVVAFQQRLHANLRRKGLRTAADIAQREVVYLLPKLAKVMTRYQRPEAYADVRMAHAVSDFCRRDRVQRGEGARLTRKDDGGMAPGRKVISGDAPASNTDDTTVFDEIRDPSDLGDEVAEAVDNARLIDQALLGQRHHQRVRLVLHLSLVEGYSDQEIGDMLGLSREYVNKLKNNALRRIQGQFGPDSV